MEGADASLSRSLLKGDDPLRETEQGAPAILRSLPLVLDA